MELLYASVPTGPVPVIVNVLNIAQFVFPIDYITPISIRGLVPLCYSLDFLREVVLILGWKWEFFPSSFSCNCNEASLEVQLVLSP